MTLAVAQKRWNSKLRSGDRKIEDIAAWLKFHYAVKQLRETAIEVGVIKSPDVVGATSGRQFRINHTQI
jgi:hypothetical protein